MLELRGLVKDWPDFSLRADLKVEEGGIVALLGPSGGGKSTLLRLAAGLERPDSGRVLVDGRDVTELPPERRGIGMVFQDLALFPHMSVRRNIEYGPRMRKVPRGVRRAEVEALAASFGIAGLLERGPYTLSGGERQRTALARALAARPSIVLLDEPLSSLDASLRHRLRTEIAQRLRAEGVAAVLVTHDAEEALAVADRLCLLRSGRVEAEGGAEELYSSPPTGWVAAFLGRGPVLEILALESAGGTVMARTPLGRFRCLEPELGHLDGAPAGAQARPLSLFFPADSIRIAGAAREGTENILAGRVESSSFGGRYRSVRLACRVLEGPGIGGSAFVDIELPPSVRPETGESLGVEVPFEACRILHSHAGAGRE